MVGSLVFFASWTRPDISFEVSRFVCNPGKQHLRLAKRFSRYSKKAITLWFFYCLSPSKLQINTWGCVDLDWAGCPESRRATLGGSLGFVFNLNGVAISWWSKHQLTVALSSAEAEFI